MEIHISKRTDIVLKAILAGALSGVIGFAQTSPSQGLKPGSPRAGSTSASQKVVMTVGNTKVTEADIDFLIENLSPQVRQAIATQGRGALGRQYSMMLLLSQKAVSDHLDASPAFQRDMALQRDQLLAHAEYQKLESEVKISPEELSAYYTAHKQDFEEASVREFVVRKKPANAKPGDPGLSQEEATARLDSIRKAILAGTDIVQVAKQFDVPNVVIIEPEPRTVRRGQLLPALDQAAFSLKDNQFSNLVNTPQAMVLLQVVGHNQPDLNDVSPEIESALRQQKVQAALDDLKAKASIWMDPVYFKSPSAPPASNPETAPQTPAHP